MLFIFQHEDSHCLIIISLRQKSILSVYNLSGLVALIEIHVWQVFQINTYSWPGAATAVPLYDII